MERWKMTEAEVEYLGRMPEVVELWRGSRREPCRTWYLTEERGVADARLTASRYGSSRLERALFARDCVLAVDLERGAVQAVDRLAASVCSPELAAA